jgi:Holliday junction DNA helicase RuvB
MLMLTDEMDNKILNTIIDKFKGGPVGLSTLATAVSESTETIEEVMNLSYSRRIYYENTKRSRSH